MKGRYLLRLSLMFLLGVVIVFYQKYWMAVLFPILLFYFIKIERDGRLKKVSYILRIVFYLFFFAAGAIRTHSALTQFHAYDQSVSDGDTIRLRGRLEGKEIKNEKLIYYVDGIVIYPNEDVASIGSYLLVDGQATLFSHARNEGNYDEFDYYRSLGYRFKMTEPDITVLKGTNFLLQEKLFDLRTAMRNYQSEMLPEEEGGILSAMTLGDKAELDTDAKELFQMSGIAHILAISGLHISLVGMAFYRRLRKFGISFTTAGIASMLLVLLYGTMCGNSVSTIRALGMFFFSVMSSMLGMAYDPLTGLAFMLVVLLIINPYYISYSGFVFSFMAVLGVFAFTIPLGQRYDAFCERRWDLHHRKTKGRRWMPNIIEIAAKSVISSFSVSLFTLPILATNYYVIPTYVVLLNLLLLPFMGLILSMGLIGSLLGINGIPFIPKLCMRICHVLIYAYEFAADKSLSLPFARVIVGNPGIGRVVVFYAIVAVFLIYLKYCSCRMQKKEEEEKKRLKETLNEHLGDYLRDYLKGSKNGDSKKTRHYQGLLKYLLTFACLILVIYYPHRMDFEITMLDVGQGDGIFVSDGSGKYLFFDGGSTTVTDVAKYRILPFLQYHGVKKIDYWFVTHTDDDHISGLIELLEDQYSIGAILIPKQMEDEENFQTIKKLAAKNGTEICFMKAGDSLVINEDEQLHFDCIWPVSDEKEDDINDNCLVGLLTYDNFSMLFTGDIAEDQEKEIIEEDRISKIEALGLTKKSNYRISPYLNENGQLNQDEYQIEGNDQGRIDVLKVCHHGSKYSSCSEFLEYLSPKVAVISAGKGNTYGHPTEEALQRIKECGATELCTIDFGQITITAIENRKAGK